MTFSDLVVSGRAFEVQASGTSSRAPRPRCAAVATLPFLCKFPKACYHFASHILVAQQAPFGLNFLGRKGAFSPKPSYKEILLLGMGAPPCNPAALQSTLIGL